MAMKSPVRARRNSGSQWTLTEFWISLCLLIATREGTELGRSQTPSLRGPCTFLVRGRVRTARHGPPWPGQMRSGSLSGCSGHWQVPQLLQTRCPPTEHGSCRRSRYFLRTRAPVLLAHAALTRYADRALRSQEALCCLGQASDQPASQQQKGKEGLAAQEQPIPAVRPCPAMPPRINKLSFQLCFG